MKQVVGSFRVGRLVALAFAFAVVAAVQAHAGVIYMDENFEGAQVFQDRHWALTGDSQQPTSAGLTQGINLRRWKNEGKYSDPKVEIGAQQGTVVSTRAFSGKKSYCLTGGQALAVGRNKFPFRSSMGSRCWQFALSTDAKSVGKPKGTRLGEFRVTFSPDTTITVCLEATGDGRADLVCSNNGAKLGSLTGASADWLLVTILAMDRVNAGTRTDTVTPWIVYDPLTRAFKGPEPGLGSGIHIFAVNKTSGARGKTWLKRGAELPVAWGSDGLSNTEETGWRLSSTASGTIFVDDFYWDARGPEEMESGFDHERGARIEQFPVGLNLGFLFTDNAVFQRDRPIPMWGISTPRDRIAAEFRGQTKLATADGAGRWRVVFDATEAGGPFDLVVKGETSVTIHNVMVGEVWVCSGQSNMALHLRESDNATSEAGGSNYPNIRLLSLVAAGAEKPVDYQCGNWQVCTPQSSPEFSAVGYFFGRDLYNGLGGKVPVGLINTSFGGTRAEAWASVPALEASGIPPENYKPSGPGIIDKGDLFNGMIHPLVSFPVRGANWYQGESNADTGAVYGTLLATLIKDWRAQWGLGNFPFQIVQLPNFNQKPGEGSWTVVREAQLQALRIPNTALAVTIDVGTPDNIHPKNKKTVGYRLAAAALAKVYGKQLVYSGPIVDSVKPERGGWLRVSFQHASGGLVDGNGGALAGFEVAGADDHFTTATAVIDGEAVRVHSDRVPKPRSVRYAWADNPRAELYNKSLLPASPFRWKMPARAKDRSSHR